MSEPAQPPGGLAADSSRPARRSFLRGVLGAGAAAGVAGSVAAGYATGASSRGARPAAAGASDPQAHLPSVQFHGLHQTGILPQPQRQTAVLSFTVTAEGRGQLTDLFQTLTDRALRR